MPDPLNRQLDQGVCLCGNRNLNKILRYYTENNEFLGILCEACNHEWLNDHAIPGMDEADGINLGGHDLRQNNPQARQFDANLQTNARTIIEDLSQLKKGDHFAYQRPYVIWHHGIVTEVDKPNRRFKAVHRHKPNGIASTGEIVKTWINVDEELGQLYRIDYPEATTNNNKAHLVIARAMAMVGKFGFNILINNCEHLARFCKTGLAESIQTHYLVNLIRRSVRKAIRATSTKLAGQIPVIIGGTAGKYLTAEAIEKAVKGTHAVGAAVVVIFEGIFMIWDFSKIHAQRTTNEISYKEFVNATITRTVEGLCAAGATILGGLAGESVGAGIGTYTGAALGTMILPGLGTFVGAAVGAGVGAFIGGVIGGTIGGLVGHVAGTFLGHIIGGALVKLIKHDDVAVQSINELTPGDQIVFYCWILHPRCHAIVVEHDGARKVKVIRNTCEKGVIQEWIDFTKPLYKVIYKPNECFPVNETLIRARSKLGGRNEYDLLMNNCKHFATWCKAGNEGNLTDVYFGKIKIP